MGKDENQEKRMTDEMSGVVTFKSQCNTCHNNDPPACEAYGKKPEKYRWNEQACPAKEPIK